LSWFYTREFGLSGEVLTDEGVPEGMLLSEVLREGPLPLRAGLELAAAMADILTIAEEDDALHGDLKPGVVRVDGSGAVSIEGYGVSRRGGRAPEGRLVGVSTDIYGLGVVLHALLSSSSLGAVPRERDAHDDYIVGKLLGIEWGEMSGKKWNDPVMHFLCSMLAHGPDERPAPLDVANILGEVALQVPGEGLVQWAGGAAPVAGADSARRPAPALAGEEDLSGPKPLGRAVSQTGAFSRRQAGRAKGECTAFWSKEKILAMLDESDSAQSSAPRPRDSRRRLPTPPMIPPVVPEGSSVPRSMDQYPSGMPDLPDSTITGKPADEALQKVIEQYKSDQGLTDEAGGGAHGVRPPAPAPEPSSSPPPAPAASAPVISGPVAGPGQAAASPPPPIAPSTVKAEPKIPWLAIVLGLGAVTMMVIIVALAVVIYQLKSPDVSTEAFSGGSPLDSAAAAATEDAEQRSKEAKPENKRRSRQERRERRERRERDAKRKKAKTGKTGKQKEAKARRGTGTFVVKFKSPGARAQLECGDGQKIEFLGTVRVSFESVTTCRVVIDGAQGAVVVREPAQFSCGAKSGRAFCRKR
jgi:hypothetical protein